MYWHCVCVCVCTEWTLRWGLVSWWQWWGSWEQASPHSSRHSSEKWTRLADTPQSRYWHNIHSQTHSHILTHTYTQGKVAYVSQQAWIQNATVKDNILFGKKLNSELYDECLSGCALESDLEILPGGDMTEIGEKVLNCLRMVPLLSLSPDTARASTWVVDRSREWVWLVQCIRRLMSTYWTTLSVLLTLTSANTSLSRSLVQMECLKGRWVFGVVQCLYVHISLWASVRVASDNVVPSIQCFRGHNFS